MVCVSKHIIFNQPCCHRAQVSQSILRLRLTPRRLQYSDRTTFYLQGELQTNRSRCKDTFKLNLRQESLWWEYIIEWVIAFNFNNLNLIDKLMQTCFMMFENFCDMENKCVSSSPMLFIYRRFIKFFFSWRFASVGIGAGSWLSCFKILHIFTHENLTWLSF